MWERDVDLTNLPGNINESGAHPLDARLPRLCGLRHRGLCLESLNPGFEPRDLRILMLALLEPLLMSALPIGEIERKVPTVRLDVPITGSENCCDRRVQERQVMAHQQDTTGVVRKISHKPLLGIEVEVVGWLVEDQCVGFTEEQPGKFHPPSLATRHRCKMLVKVVRCDTEA